MKKDQGRAEAYVEVMRRLESGEATPEDFRLALAYQLKVNAELASMMSEMGRRQQQLEERLYQTREERPEDKKDLRPTPAMRQETMRKVAYRARVGKAAQKSGYTMDDWELYCARHGHDPTKMLRTARTGAEADERQLDLMPKPKAAT